MKNEPAQRKLREEVVGGGERQRDDSERSLVELRGKPRM
jgi:hypothetical protein